MAEEFDRQRAVDDEHLKLLSIGYMISAAMTAVLSLFSLIYVVFGVGIVVALSKHSFGEGGASGPPPAVIGWVITGVGLGIFVFALVVAALKFRVAMCIKQRKSRTFCMVIAAICCLGVPYGTLLGVFTFIVFGRPSVMRQFEAAPS
jgi:hypothetical protein